MDSGPSHWISLILFSTLVLSMSLWTLKLFTTELCEHTDGRECCLILRTAPALYNRVVELERAVPPADPIYLMRPDCMGNYEGDDIYRWLVDYGYAASSTLSVLHLALALRKRRRRERPLPSIFD